MADAPYQTQNFLLKSLGVVARPADDAVDPGHYLQLDSLEEIEENSLASRLGTTILNKVGTAAMPIAGSFLIGNPNVHSLQKLSSIPAQGNVSGAWRYASRGARLYRIAGLNPGAYTLLSASLNGQPWGSAVYSPSVTGYPYLYIADLNGMLKDNGSLAAPQKAGIFQPQYPVQAQAQPLSEIVLDSFVGSTYATSGVGAFTANTTVNTSTSGSAIAVTGLQEVVFAASWRDLFQSLIFDVGGANQETVLVLQVTDTGFVANFTKTHLTGVTVNEAGWTGTVATSTTATVSKTFVGTPIAAWPTTLDPADYIGLSLYVGDPNAIQSITLQFNTANGAYFYRTIGQGPLQQALNAQTDSSTAAETAVLTDTLGVYTPASGGVTSLNTVPGWTPFLVQLESFSGAGGADFNDPVTNWQNVTGYQITIVTGTGIATTSFPITIKAGSLLLLGGAGPDTFAGVAYDYLVTYFNINDYTESNPSMSMTNVNPPSNTNWVYPRRQPVLLTITNGSSDTQITHLRIYRRGGTLGDNYRRIDQVPLTAGTGGTQTYLDIWSDADIQQADVVSFTNDVPVTSPLPVPMNNTLGSAIVTTNGVVTVVLTNQYDTLTGGFTVPLWVGQQVNIGNVVAANFETVIVLTVTRVGILGRFITGFTAFVQNTHALNEPLSATAKYGQPFNIMAVAFDQGWYAGDYQNPSYLYWTPKGNLQAVSSASYEPVSSPGDGITAIVGTAANLFVSTLQRWWSVAPGSNVNSSPTIYPTNVDHGCVGPRAWTLKDGTVFYLGLDGLRTMRGGGGEYISEIIEFVWQNTGPTPIPIADPTQFATVQASWWNRWVFFSYIALDGNRHRIILDVDNKRYRCDDLDAHSMFLEEDTGTLVWGDSQGLIHLDRQLVQYDETNVAGTVTQSPIAFTLQTPYGNQGMPEVQKQYQEFTLDCNTNGNPVGVTLSFDDGETTEFIGTVTTTVRERINLNINNGEGFQAYKASLLLTGSGITRIYLFQAKLKYLPLAMTRQSLDTYWLRFGTDESKICKQAYFEYNAGAVISGAVYYDDSPTVGFPFTLPQYSGIRNPLRVRFPAVKFRMMRCILTSAADFQVWNESNFEVKPLCQGKGYAKFPMMP